MNNLAFIYDHRYYIEQDKIYSSGAFNYKVWKRFLDAFDHLTVFGTLLPAKEINTSSLNRVDGKNISFEHVPYLKSVGQFAKSLISHNKHVHKKVKTVDAAVVRLPGRASINAYWTLKQAGIPVAVEAVGCPWDAYWNYGTVQGKIMAPLMRWRMQRVLNDASHAVFVSEEFLQNRYPTFGKSINASNVEIKIPSRQVLERKIEKINQKSADDVFKIGIMGSMGVRYKGHHELLKAIKSIRAAIPKLKVEMVGSGEYKWILKLADKLGLSNLINIRGKIPSGEPVMNWLDSLDLYVHPSKQEGLPRSVIEAMSRGCPVLASSVGGIPELLDDEYMHSPGDYGELAFQLNKYINDKDELIIMAKKNYRISKKYDSSILKKRRRNFWKQFADQI